MLIGLTGASGSRKTVAAKRLQKMYGFDRIHAGDPVKKAVMKGFGLNKDQVKGDGKDMPSMQLGGMTPRTALEAVGTAMHTTAPLATTQTMSRRVTKRMSKGKHVVVDGIRSGVEAQAIRTMGGKVVRMDNGEPPNQSMPLDMKQASIEEDHKLTHNGSRKDVHQKLDDHMAKTLGVPRRMNSSGEGQ